MTTGSFGRGQHKKIQRTFCSYQIICTSDWIIGVYVAAKPVNYLFFFFSSPSRFGHLIKVYLVAGKNVGYAKFADRASASDAITALHGKIVNGVRLKVRLADSPTEESNKRQRTY